MQVIVLAHSIPTSQYIRLCRLLSTLILHNTCVTYIYHLVLALTHGQHMQRGGGGAWPWELAKRVPLPIDHRYKDRDRILNESGNTPTRLTWISRASETEIYVWYMQKYLLNCSISAWLTVLKSQLYFGNNRGQRLPKPKRKETE